MIASPSTQNPDYLYSWTRDSALVFNLLIEDFVSGDDPSLRRHIDAYIPVETIIPQIANPSGPAGEAGLASQCSISMALHLLPLGAVRSEVCGARILSFHI